jgi:hypothetical protein
MTDQKFVAAGGAIGPDDLHIPAQPGELKQALEQLNELADQLDAVRATLDKAAGDEDVHGETAFALQRVVRFSRFTARRDAGMLKELAETVQQEIKVLHDVQGDEMERLRTRWQQARHELVAAAKEGDGPGAQQLAHRLDADITEPYVPMFRRLTGITPEPVGGGAPHAMLVGSPLADAVQEYRRTVNNILEEFESAVRSVRGVEEDVRANLHWEKRQKAEDPEENDAAGDSQVDKDPAGISGPRVLRRMLDALEEGSGSLDNLVPALKAIDKAITSGMLPDHDNQHPQVFQNEWENHFQRRIRRMRVVSKTADKMATELKRLDADTAAQIFKDNDEPARD